MTITCVCGTWEDIVKAGHIIQGNGKNITAVWYAYVDYLRGKKVYSNFKLQFAECLPAQEIIDLSLRGEIKDCTIILDEMSLILNSLGEKGEVLKFIMKWVKQLRKMGIDLYWIEQRANDVHLRLRTHTSIALEPEKYHTNGYDNNPNEWEICTVDQCKRTDHRILVFSKKPWISIPLKILNPQIIGQLYDSKEIILDSIKLEKGAVEKLNEELREKRQTTPQQKELIKEQTKEEKEKEIIKQQLIKVKKKHPEQYDKLVKILHLKIPYIEQITEEIKLIETVKCEQ